MSLLRPPSVTRACLRVWQRDFLFYRKTWAISFLWTMLEPLMYLGAIGYGLGSYVTQMGGVSYVEFFLPGILCSTAMTVAFFEGTYGCYTKLTWQKTYSTILLTRISPEEIVVGELLWTASKGFFGACGVAVVAALLGLIQTWHIFPGLLTLFFVSWLFATLGMIVTSIVRSYDSFIYSTSGFLIPMSLISGTYFPIEQLPIGLKQLAWVLPLTHGVVAVRELLSGDDFLSAGLHTLLLAGMGWIAMNYAIVRIRQKLIK